MRKRQAIFAVVALLLFGLNVAGASWLSLTGSDTQPYEANFPAQCATPTVSFVYEVDSKKDKKVTEIRLSGDFSNCIGSQVLVAVHKSDQSWNYAVKDITTAASSISLFFEKQDGTGDFRQRFPDVINQRLVPVGPLAPPANGLDEAGTKVTFSWSWS